MGRDGKQILITQRVAVIRAHHFQVNGCTADDNCAKPNVIADFEIDPVQKLQDNVFDEEVPNNNVYDDEEEPAFCFEETRG